MRHPEWIKVDLTGTHETKKILRHHGLSTVCEEARCPNQGKCFSTGTATFMILGDKCTRSCSFCAVESSTPNPPDSSEPEKVAEATIALGLKFVVITSVTRDDLPDRGSGQFAKTITAIRRKNPEAKIEVLTPDFGGDIKALKTVLATRPDVFNHNVETVPRLYSRVRPGADFSISLKVLEFSKSLFPDVKTKSGIMVGLGEKHNEVVSVVGMLREVGCDFLTIGQYLRPRKENTPVVEYIRPEVFEQYKIRGLAMGFKSVASSPLTRSSMNAEEMYSYNTNTK